VIVTLSDSRSDPQVKTIKAIGSEDSAEPDDSSDSEHGIATEVTVPIFTEGGTTGRFSKEDFVRTGARLGFSSRE
jgi:hypothetical protein